MGLGSGDIIILDTTTGTHRSILSSHTGLVGSLTFSLDGDLLVSGSRDKTIKLWDIQTGGVIRTFYGHTGWVSSVSISPDCTTVASGSGDWTTRVWDLQTGECCCVMQERNGSVTTIMFSPIHFKHLISASTGGRVSYRDTSGHQLKYDEYGDGIAFSPDGETFVEWAGRVAHIKSYNSTGDLGTFHVPNNHISCCCFSPNGKVIAGAAGKIIYIWNITQSKPQLIETFIGHTSQVTFLAFSPSSLTSASLDQSVKFWQINCLSTTHPATGGQKSMPSAPVPIWSVGLQTKKVVAISNDLDGVIKTWDISTGICRASFPTLAGGQTWRDVQMVDDKLIFVWLADRNIYIWDVEKSQLLQTVDISSNCHAKDLRISGDGSMVFLLDNGSIQAWMILTGEVVGMVGLEGNPYPHSLTVDGSRVWVHSEDLPIQGWDFRAPGSPPVPLSNVFPDRCLLDFIDGTKDWNTGLPRIENTTTGQEVFQLPGRYSKPTTACWDGRYLVAGYNSGDVLILDFNCIIPG